MLYIRADGNTEVGMGHVMRCLSVAEAVADIDHVYPPVFITADEGCRPMIEERGFRVIVLGTDYRDMMSELPRLACLFHGQDVLLVDSYQADSGYYLALRRLVLVACFEDLGQPYPVELLINYNIYAPKLEARYRAAAPGAPAADRYPRRVLLGAAYMPLRKAFQEPSEYEVRDTVTSVTITTGGSDPCFAAAAITDVLIGDSALACARIHLNIVSGPFNRFADQLKGRYQGNGNITVHEDVKDMRSLLSDSDVVISATGSTIYEVSALGVPMIVFYFAENQRQGAGELERLTDIVNAGCFAEEGEAVADRIRAALRRCVSDRAYRELLSRQERGLIDGRGARRIAEQLTGLAAGSDREGKKIKEIGNGRNEGEPWPQEERDN